MHLGSRSLLAISFALAACGEVSRDTPDAPVGGTDAPLAASCTNGLRDGAETDVDCGGGTCDPCGATRACGAATDCLSMVCTGGTCQTPSCSDGVRNGTELDVDCAGNCGPGSCDPGQTCSTNADCASNLCNGVCVAVKRVFVSSALYTGGQIGNLMGGDQKCQALANAAGLTGTFRAWLSTTGTNARDRIVAADARFVLVDGTQVADNKADLLDGTLDNAITKTETGGVPSPSDGFCDASTTWVHGSTRADGTLYDANANCANFTVDTGGGGWGKWDTAGDTWSHACGGGAPVNFCAKRAHVYCFEE
ncbi:MAG: hypothetical protein IPH44_32665 [Myxococcales bacterium]|nr:hypothetical protein [Myxococcales bacterium]MBK7193483.1 hypothetical protein [Myxococcales bacterium]MBP6846862.1 hypothetical protein [Kofleriaceae bacterium]